MKAFTQLERRRAAIGQRMNFLFHVTADESGMFALAWPVGQTVNPMLAVAKWRWQGLISTRLMVSMMTWVWRLNARRRGRGN